VECRSLAEWGFQAECEGAAVKRPASIRYEIYCYVESLRKLKKAAERVIVKVKNAVKGAAKNAHFVSLSEEPAPALRRYFIDRSLPDRSKMDI
jgi:hypothetical protein